MGVGVSDSRNLETHLFICTNSKEKGESCGMKGSADLRNAVKEICQKESKGWHGRIRVNTAGCLGRCKEGIAAVFYPQSEWLVNLKRDDSSVLESKIASILD
jgi:predicted metal-binding protein